MNEFRNVKMDGKFFGVVLNYAYLYEKKLSQFHDKAYLRETQHTIIFIKILNIL